MYCPTGKCHYEVLQLNSEVIAAVKYHCVLETPKTLGTNILVKTLKDESMDNQQETKIISNPSLYQSPWGASLGRERLDIILSTKCWDATL